MNLTWNVFNFSFFSGCQLLSWSPFGIPRRRFRGAWVPSLGNVTQQLFRIEKIVFNWPNTSWTKQLCDEQANDCAIRQFFMFRIFNLFFNLLLSSTVIYSITFICDISILIKMSTRFTCALFFYKKPIPEYYIVH